MKNSENNDIKKKTSISIGTYYINIIEREIASGKFSSASEVIRAALRKLDESSKRFIKKKQQ